MTRIIRIGKNKIKRCLLLNKLNFKNSNNITIFKIAEVLNKKQNSLPLYLQKQAEFLQYYNSGTPEWNRTTARGSGEMKISIFALVKKLENALFMRHLTISDIA